MKERESSDLSESEWKKRLSKEEYRVMREEGTEAPFSGKYNSCKEIGIYRCKGCGLPLFHSIAKYDSGTGWPSYWEPISEENIAYDGNEVHCAGCTAHLGHVFNDGPPPTYLRYCINSICLNLEKDG